MMSSNPSAFVFSESSAASSNDVALIPSGHLDAFARSIISLRLSFFAPYNNGLNEPTTSTAAFMASTLSVSNTNGLSQFSDTILHTSANLLASLESFLIEIISALNTMPMRLKLSPLI